MNKCCKRHNILAIPKIVNNLSDNSIIIKAKDKIPKGKQTGVVYKFDCSECPATYVGETKREVGIRIGEHRAPIDAIIRKDDKEKNKNEIGFPRKRPQRRVVIEKSPSYIDNSDNQEKQKTTSEDNVVLTHFKKTRYNFSWPKFRILDHESNYHKRNTSEVLYINIYKNTINEQGDSEKLFKP